MYISHSTAFMTILHKSCEFHVPVTNGARLVTRQIFWQQIRNEADQFVSDQGRHNKR